MKLEKRLLSLGIVASLVGLTACSTTPATDETKKSEVVTLVFARGKDTNGGIFLDKIMINWLPCSVVI